MELSVFAQYHIRKLLSRYVDQLAYPLVQGAGVQFNSSFLHLNRTLRQLAPEDALHCERVLELETLIRMYHELEAGHAWLEQRAIHLECRILELLGLRVAPVAHSLPVMLRESSVCRFTFLWNGQIQAAIHYEHEFYGSIREFSGEDRLQAYRLAWDLREQGVPCLLTASETCWGVWAGMRSPAYSTLIQQGVERCQPSLSIPA